MIVYKRSGFWVSPTAILDEETDEVLLAVLARNAEPPPRHDMPHRRYVRPEQDTRPPEEKTDWSNWRAPRPIPQPDWRRVADGWWAKRGDDYGRAMSGGRQ